MKNYINILRQTVLFSGIDANEIEAMLPCLSPRLKSYKKGEYVYRRGDVLENIAVLLSGEIHIQSDDYWGNCSILGHVGVGEMFGEAYVLADGCPLLNDVVATRDSTVVFFDVNRVITTCGNACRFHASVVKNLFAAISEKNRKLVLKLGHISKRSTREKLMSYLSEQAKSNNSSSFEIPFNRRQLADFLSVDRSAMSNELCKMRDSGLLEFNKNKFRLL